MSTETENLHDLLNNSYVTLVEEVMGENLLSILIYGSAAGEGYVKKVSDVNLLLIVKELDPDRLIAFGKRTRRITRKRKIVPLVLTRSEFEHSADVFPMEYLDIQRRNVVLTGTDESSRIEISEDNLRHQLESSMRGNLNLLRQAIVAARGRKRILGHFLKSWLGRQHAVFKAFLRLKGTNPVPTNLREVADAVQEATAFDTAPFNTLIEYRDGNKTDTKIDPVELSGELHRAMQDLVTLVDSME